MHRLTYYRPLGQAMAAQERALGLEIDWLRRRFDITAVKADLKGTSRENFPVGL